jgi:hypothetical protein
VAYTPWLREVLIDYRMPYLLQLAFGQEAVYLRTRETMDTAAKRFVSVMELDPARAYPGAGVEVHHPALLAIIILHRVHRCTVYTGAASWVYQIAPA